MVEKEKGEEGHSIMTHLPVVAVKMDADQQKKNLGLTHKAVHALFSHSENDANHDRVTPSGVVLFVFDILTGVAGFAWRQITWRRVLVFTVLGALAAVSTIAYAAHLLLINAPTPKRAPYKDLYLNEANEYACTAPGSAWHRLITAKWDGTIEDVQEETTSLPQVVIRMKSNSTGPVPPSIETKRCKLGPNYFVEMPILETSPSPALKVPPNGSIKAVFTPISGDHDRYQDASNAILAYHIDCLLGVGRTPPVAAYELPSRSELRGAISDATARDFEKWGMGWQEFMGRIPGTIQYYLGTHLPPSMQFEKLSPWLAMLEPIADALCEEYGYYCLDDDANRARNERTYLIYIMGEYLPHEAHFWGRKLGAKISSSLWNLDTTRSCKKEPRPFPLPALTANRCRFDREIYNRWRNLGPKQTNPQKQIYYRIQRSLQQDPFIRKYRNRLEYAPLNKIESRIRHVLRHMHDCVYLFGAKHVFGTDANEKQISPDPTKGPHLPEELMGSCVSRRPDVTNEQCRGIRCAPDYAAACRWTS
eukprot:comp22641_c3_seq2/m.34861 comp22641_c3_seq2/g.34861  ORF comp22641_c3_seq2/g.34861 comp22641_c3_seq2/m.34861 type:complete len:534 (-) comp22641_c3_seq2:687-2288(-)